MPRYVVEQMSDYLYHHNANTHWAYPTSAETDAALEDAREVLCRILERVAYRDRFWREHDDAHASSLARARTDYQPGDEIVVTELEHHANIDPWRRLAVERGVTIRTVRMNTATGQLNWEDLERFVGPKTKLLAIGAASNALGTINDVERAIELAHDAGALVFVDAVHYAPHALIDVEQLDCDFLGMSAYKFYGPHIGVLFAKRACSSRSIFRSSCRRRITHRRMPRLALRIRKAWSAQPQRSISLHRLADSRTAARACAVCFRKCMRETRNCSIACGEV